MNKKALSEPDICTKYITPALVHAGWDLTTQIREEVTFTAGRVIVRGKITARGKALRADYILYYRPNLPIAVIKAKSNRNSVGAGMQQALGYAETLDLPFVFSSNGDAFLFHDKTRATDDTETEIPLDQFPSPEHLWYRYCMHHRLEIPPAPAIHQEYHTAVGGKTPGITSKTPSTGPSRPSPGGKIEFCW